MDQRSRSCDRGSLLTSSPSPARAPHRHRSPGSSRKPHTHTLPCISCPPRAPSSPADSQLGVPSPDAGSQLCHGDRIWRSAPSLLPLPALPVLGLCLQFLGAPPLPCSSLRTPPPFHLPNDPLEPRSQDLMTRSSIRPGSGRLLTLHGESDRLAGLVIPVLVINSLHVVAACVGSHRRQDDEGVLQGDGSVQRKGICHMGGLGALSIGGWAWGQEAGGPWSPSSSPTPGTTHGLNSSMTLCRGSQHAVGAGVRPKPSTGTEVRDHPREASRPPPHAWSRATEPPWPSVLSFVTASMLRVTLSAPGGSSTKEIHSVDMNKERMRRDGHEFRDEQDHSRIDVLT